MAKLFLVKNASYMAYMQQYVTQKYLNSRHLFCERELYVQFDTHYSVP